MLRNDFVFSRLRFRYCVTFVTDLRGCLLWGWRCILVFVEGCHMFVAMIELLFVTEINSCFAPFNYDIAVGNE